MSEKRHHLVIAVSSRALFNLDESHKVFIEEGMDAYAEYQIAREEDILDPGAAFPLVRKLLALNNGNKENPLVEVILLSKNSADTGLRVFNSIQHYGLNITRAAFSSGENPYQYINAFEADLFLSTNPEDIQNAIRSGLAAASIILNNNDYDHHKEDDGEIRIAFDGDAVIFSNESDIIFQSQGLTAFSENEVKTAKEPMGDGPFKEFLASLHQLQELGAPIRTALVTARSVPAHERVIRTLRSWDIRIDEAFFLGGLDKNEFLKAFQADIYFDDSPQTCESTSQHVPTGYVPHDTISDQ